MLLEIEAGNPGLSSAPYKDIFIFTKAYQGRIACSLQRDESLPDNEALTWRALFSHVLSFSA